MKIFETPELKISKFNRGNIITLSGGDQPTEAKNAVAKAQEIAAARYADTSVFSFAVGS